MTAHPRTRLRRSASVRVITFGSQQTKIMFRKLLLSAGIALLLLSQIRAAQFLPASPPIAYPGDTRFTGVKEDLTSPALKTSNLTTVPPVVGYIDDFPIAYTVELIQVQWRF